MKALSPPLHHVDHIELDPASGALAMVLAGLVNCTGSPKKYLKIFENNLFLGAIDELDKAHQVELDLARAVLSDSLGRAWAVSRVALVGQLLTFDLGGGEHRASETAPGATLVDFVVGEGDSFFLVDTNGNVYENGDLLANSQITGDNLRIQMIAPNVLVIAGRVGRSHALAR